MSDLDLQPLDFFGKLDPLGVGQRPPLLANVPQVEHLAHEIDGWLRPVERGGAHVNVQHHLPVRGPHRLVEARPDLSAAAERVGVPLERRAEEAPADRRVAHARQVPHHHVQRVDGGGAEISRAALERLLEGVEGDLRLPPDPHPEHPVPARRHRRRLAPGAGQRHLELERRPGGADLQWFAAVEVSPPVENRHLGAEDFAVGPHHGVDDLSVDAPRTLVGLYGDDVMVDVAPGDVDLEVVRPQYDRLTHLSQVGAAWQIKDRELLLLLRGLGGLRRHILHELVLVKTHRGESGLDGGSV